MSAGRNNCNSVGFIYVAISTDGAIDGQVVLLSLSIHQAAVVFSSHCAFICYMHDYKKKKRERKKKEEKANDVVNDVGVYYCITAEIRWSKMGKREYNKTLLILLLSQRIDGFR